MTNQTDRLWRLFSNTIESFERRNKQLEELIETIKFEEDETRKLI